MLRTSYQQCTGKALIDPAIGDVEAVEALDLAPFALLSHGREADPVFNYGNRCALQLFEMSWEQLTRLPSRLSAEPMLQAERAQLLARVAQHGYIDDYSDVRISKSGKRFLICNATVWNLLDEDGQLCGQAALLPEWQPLDGEKPGKY
jgi:hypothetical protein